MLVHHLRNCTRCRQFCENCKLQHSYYAYTNFACMNIFQLQSIQVYVYYFQLQISPVLTSNMFMEQELMSNVKYFTIVQYNIFLYKLFANVYPAQFESCIQYRVDQTENPYYRQILLSSLLFNLKRSAAFCYGIVYFVCFISKPDLTVFNTKQKNIGQDVQHNFNTYTYKQITPTSPTFKKSRGFNFELNDCPGEQ